MGNSEVYYEVKRNWKKPLLVKSKFVRCEDAVYYFYNKEDRSDIDQPEAMFKQNEVSKIIKKNKEVKNGKRK
jgi:hypothetical protein